MKEISIGDSLIETIGESGGYGFLAGIAEVGLDSCLQAGILKDVPIFGSLSKIVGGYIGVREYLLFKKIIRFLTAVRTIPAGEIKNFMCKLEESKKEKKKFGEMLFLMLDRFDDVDKAEYAARAFRALASSQIQMDMFLRFLVVIDGGFLPDLIILQYHEKPEKFQETTIISLANSGLLAIPSFASYDSLVGYRITELGRQFIQHVLYRTNEGGA